MTNRFFCPLSVVMLLMLTVACHDSHYEEDVDSVDFVTDIAHNEADTMIVNTTTQQTIVLQHCRALESGNEANTNLSSHGEETACSLLHFNATEVLTFMMVRTPSTGAIRQENVH